MNKEPFQNIDLMFFTHHHTDHFDAEATNEILKRNKHIQLIATRTVLDMLAACDNYNEMLSAQIRPLSVPQYKSIQMNLRGIPCEVTSLLHDGEIYQGVENYSYLFELKNKLFLHVGDAQASLNNLNRQVYLNDTLITDRSVSIYRIAGRAQNYHTG